jgi:NAD(P)H-hydrate epimerase
MQILDSDQIPYLTADQMLEVDRLMVEDYGIQLIQMMENAGRNLAILAWEEFLNRNPSGKTVDVLAGSGGNGGGALVCARHLINWGAEVKVFLTKPINDLVGVTKTQGEILTRMGQKIGSNNNLHDRDRQDLILDGIIGYSLVGSPRGNAAEMIRWANAGSAPILALDLPSGLDATTGKAKDPVIKAEATMTLALPKTGLKHSPDLVGELYLADIGVPPELYSRQSLNLQVGSIFQDGSILKIT